MAKQVIINNNLISYNQSGTGDSAVIFLHGWRSQKEVWSLVLGKLEASSYNLKAITIDLPGFGQSSIPKEPWTVGDYAEIVKGFIEKLELKNVIIVGHSFGGRVGIKLAAKYPDIISKLVLVDSAGFVTERTKKRVMELTAKLVKPFFVPKFMQGLRRKIYSIIGADDYVATPWLTKTFIKAKDEDLTQDMKKISCPTLIIYGENDKETPVEFGQRMNKLIVGSKLVIFSDSGHFSFLDQPEEFVKILKEFV